MKNSRFENLVSFLEKSRLIISVIVMFTEMAVFFRNEGILE